MNKQNLGWIIAGILLLILIVAGLYFSYQEIHERAYDKGFEIAQFSIAHQITNTGNIPIYDSNNGTIIWYSLNQICQGKIV